MQETPHLEIATVRYFSDREGGQRISTWRPLVVGQTIQEAVYNHEKGCGFIYREPNVPTGALTGWTIEARPLEISADRVRLRIVWSRVAQDGSRVTAPSGDVNLLLRPGNVVTLDTIAMPRCDNTLASFVVALKGEAPERLRVASTELWLAHRDADGKETTQELNVRSQLGERSSDAFEAIKVGAFNIDVAVSLTPRLLSGNQIELAFGTTRHVMGSKPGAEWGQYGSGTTVLTVTPDDVISVALPLPTGEGFESLAGHSLSIRVRSRLVR